LLLITKKKILPTLFEYFHKTVLCLEYKEIYLSLVVSESIKTIE